MHIDVKNVTDLTTALLTSGNLSSGHVRELVQKFPQAHGLIGEFPDELVRNIPQIQRPTVKRTILAGLAQIQRKLRGDQEIVNWNDTRSFVGFASDTTLAESSQMLADTFSHTCSKDGLTKRGSGAFGAVYGFKVNGNSYIFKSFLPDSEYRKGHGWLEARRHGIFSEAPMGAYWHANAPESQFDTMHFADLEEGYMVSKDVDTLTPPNKPVEMTTFGITDTDPSTISGSNSKNGYNFDFGGQEIVFPILAFNKTARAALAEVQKTPAEKRLTRFMEIYHQDSANQRDIKAGLHLALKLLPKEEARKVPFGVKADLLASYVKSKLV